AGGDRLIVESLLIGSHRRHAGPLQVARHRAALRAKAIAGAGCRHLLEAARAGIETAAIAVAGDRFPVEAGAIRRNRLKVATGAIRRHRLVVGSLHKLSGAGLRAGRGTGRRTCRGTGRRTRCAAGWGTAASRAETRNRTAAMEAADLEHVVP